jgi:4-aminobutyrate aminotransferase
MATLEVIEAEGLSNAASMGTRLRTGLEGVADGVAAIRDIRGVGLMLGVEFESHEAAEAVQQAAFERGLLTLECGESSLRFSPPLIVDSASVDTAVRIFGEAIAAA